MWCAILLCSCDIFWFWGWWQKTIVLNRHFCMTLVRVWCLQAVLEFTMWHSPQDYTWLNRKKLAGGQFMNSRVTGCCWLKVMLIAQCSYNFKTSHRSYSCSIAKSGETHSQQFKRANVQKTSISHTCHNLPEFHANNKNPFTGCTPLTPLLINWQVCSSE